jgi:hypothetical protein
MSTLFGRFYRKTKAGWVDIRNGRLIGFDPTAAPVRVGQIIPDMPAHIGPSGRYISGRAEAIDECKRTDTVFRDIKRRPKGYLNQRSAEGSRLGWNRGFVEHFKNERAKAFKAAGL